jgi:hypothetical protein
VTGRSSRTRRLSPGEIETLSSVYGAAVDYGKVRIRKGGILTAFDYAVTLYNVVFFPRDLYSDDISGDKAGHTDLLVHEVCHVWQHQTQPYHWAYALREHMRYGKSVYRYDIEAHESLLDYRWEQQGQILQDYYRARAKDNGAVTRYEAVIYQAIPRPGVYGGEEGEWVRGVAVSSWSAAPASIGCTHRHQLNEVPRPERSQERE